MKPDPIALLQKLEWFSGLGHERRCPTCHRSERKAQLWGHAPGCEMAACLALPQSEEPAVCDCGRSIAHRTEWGCDLCNWPKGKQPEQQEAALKAAFDAHTANETKFTRRMAINMADMDGTAPKDLVLRLEHLGLLKAGSWDWFVANGGISEEQIAAVRSDRRMGAEGFHPDLRRIVHDRLENVRLGRYTGAQDEPLSEYVDIEAVTQNICVDIEKLLAAPETKP